MYKNQYVNFSKKELNFQGGYYGKVEAEHFKMQRLLFMSVCPTKAISISDHVNKKGYAEIQVDQEKCVGCGSCYRMCPDYVFEVL